MTLPKRYKEYETEEEPVKCEEEGYEYRWICQGCKEEGHKQGEVNEVHDCKVVFMKDGEQQSQCCCYSEAHGKRSDD